MFNFDDRGEHIVVGAGTVAQLQQLRIIELGTYKSELQGSGTNAVLAAGSCVLSSNANSANKGCISKGKRIVTDRQIIYGNCNFGGLYWDDGHVERLALCCRPS